MGSGPSKVLPPQSEFDEVHVRGPDERLLGGEEGGNGVVLPSEVHGRAIRLSLRETKSPFRTEIRNVTSDDDRNQEYAGGAMTIGRYMRPERRSRRLELVDGDGKTIAVCLKMQSTPLRRTPRFKVYGTRPAYDGQDPSREQKQRRERRGSKGVGGGRGENGKGGPLYAWAEIRGQNFKYEMETMRRAGGTEGGNGDGDETTENSGGISYRSEEVASRTGPQVVIWKNDRPAAVINRKPIEVFSKKYVTELTISPGVDPCLMLCFVAVMGEHERLQTEMSSSEVVLGLVTAGM
eukprot:CAMPEP_0197443142 /NCGR_PEP_ID=MMETSP1175-20131217/8974_1 /TAXON_ID=1003142 /ORGANISM="Triceratium dubium, Strain CCMP147" /LENGTH=292 /DNA_ID=CAMNT_0042973739 /DNA_START=125 /DNA_END=1003 /DNA_ORIENTATION=-